jgi:hypothetical protein
MYYSKHFGNDIFVKQRDFSDLNILHHGQWKQYDYLAIRLNKITLATEAALLQEMGDKPVIIFYSNHDKDQVRIYRGKK